MPDFMKSKEVYKTIKRSISGSAFSNHPSSSSSSQNTPFVSKWMHPPVALIKGRVEYTLKFIGNISVSESKGTNAVKEAIHALRFQHQINEGIVGHSGSKLQRVVLQISIDGVRILDHKTKICMFEQQLLQISFCADNKKDKRVFSYIAKTDTSPNECFVFLSDKLAEDITLTIAEAFDLAHERFIRLRKNELDEQKVLFMNRLSHLEDENAILRRENRELRAQLVGGLCAPALPTTRPPPRPPNLKNLPPLPPQTPPDMPAPTRPSAFNDVFENEIFSFDQSNGEPSIQSNPSDAAANKNYAREECQDEESDDNSKPTSRQNGRNTSHIDSLTKRMNDLDYRMAEMSEVFRSGLALGDTGDIAQDLELDEA